jgi:GntR family transcriptional regulator
MKTNTEPMPKGPLYQGVKRRILERLAAGEWKPGDRLPSEPELAARFGVAISTVRAGLADLSSAGVLVKRQGKGNFVATHDLAHQQFRFQHVYSNDAGKVSTTRKVISLRKVRASIDTRRHLELRDDVSDVLEMHAVLHAEERPIALMELILPFDLFKGLSRAELENGEENLYSYYQRAFGVTVLRMQEQVSTRVADARTAQALHLEIGHPLMLVNRTAYTYGNRPVELRRRLYEGLQHHYLFTHDELD